MGISRWVHFLKILSGKYHRKKDVVAERECIQQVKILEDETEMISAESRDILFADLREIHAVQKDFASGGPVERGQDVQQCGFAGPGFAHDHGIFSCFHGEGDV